ncbi:hypothetical protein B4Q13_19790, partial [Lacticaseibacillus rhamnosus]
MVALIKRQNARIIRLEQENAALRRELSDVRALLAAVEQQNALLRTQVAQLQAENDQLKGIERPPKPPAPEWPAGHAKPKTEERTRKKRDRRHNHGRQRMAELAKKRAEAQAALKARQAERRAQIAGGGKPGPSTSSPRRSCAGVQTEVDNKIPGVKDLVSFIKSEERKFNAAVKSEVEFVIDWSFTGHSKFKALSDDEKKNALD